MSTPTVAQMDRAIVEQLVNDLLAAGLDLTIKNTTDENGPDWITTNDRELVLHNLGHMEEDTIRAYDKGRYVGLFYFVYGNDGYDVLADYTSTEEVERLLMTVNLMSEEYQEQIADELFSNHAYIQYNL
jgi:uncharacterized protein YtpQ (UPF0354 family)